ncbi:MAG TPA: hypothetical protein VM942_11055 [Acidimicrobiales bacterium]|nr:hypothetical protein [Acidimicrobiales bacterium]
MAAEPSSPADEALEAFYGDDPDEARRLAGTADPDVEDAPVAAARRRMPVTGALMAGIAMGLRDVFEPEYHDRIAVEQPAPEQPLEPQKYEVHLDPVAPESSFAIYRPWVDDEAGDARPPPDRDGRGTGSGAGALGG